MPFKSDSRRKPRLAGAKPKAPQFSRLLAVETVPDTGLNTRVCATEAECALLATRCGVASVQSFVADFLVCKQGRGRFNVSGKLQARVIQICVVSLEPFESEIFADIDVEFAPCGNQPPGPSSTQGDPPDPIVDGQIDLGALAVEFLVLNLDLYPRKPGVVFEDADVGGKASERESPFAVLLRR
jgi:Large ribosomal RNA subunit accumulation protein YceD